MAAVNDEESFLSFTVPPCMHLQVMGKPSNELAAKMSAEEKERVAQQQKALGEEGLREKGGELEKAITQNEVLILYTNTIT